MSFYHRRLKLRKSSKLKLDLQFCFSKFFVYVFSSNISISPLPTIDKESDYYDMNRKQRGFAIILNHEFFDDDKNKPRTGTNKDTDMLKITLKKLGFDVKIHKDLERKEIKRTLQECKSKNFQCDNYHMQNFN